MWPAPKMKLVLYLILSMVNANTGFSNLDVHTYTLSYIAKGNWESDTVFISIYVSKLLPIEYKIRWYSSIYKTERVNYYTVYNEKKNNYTHVGLPTVVQDISNVFQHKSLWDIFRKLRIFLLISAYLQPLKYNYT